MSEKKEWQWLKEDHITYAVWDIQFWRFIYTHNLGFREIHHTADASPDGQSSMELYGLEQGGSRIALVRPDQSVGGFSCGVVSVYARRS